MTKDQPKGFGPCDLLNKTHHVVTFAFFIPEQQSGEGSLPMGVTLANEMIDKILNVLYPDLVYAQSLW